MITPELEKLILTGQAEYKNFTGSWSSLLIFNVPDGKYIIITDININFASSFQNSNTDVFLQFQTNKKNIYYVFKPAIDTNLKSTQVPQNINTYLLFTEDIRLRILSNTNAPGAIDYNFLGNEAKEPPSPAGFGLTIPVTKRITLAGNEDYVPQSIKFGASFASATKRNEYFLDVVSGNELPSMGSQSDNFILNLGYVIVNKPYTNQLN